MNRRLSSLKVGQSGKIILVDVADKKVKQHLLDMGLVRGTRVKVKKIAPSGSPIDIELRGYELCVGRKELDNIIVEIT
ncbi:MAG: ferrous iron transport protein A [Clostridia bacterium]|nr:ferrous iron transport protein A [Clostridia bacterium]